MWHVDEFAVAVWAGGEEPARRFVTSSAAEAGAAFETAAPFLLDIEAVVRGPAAGHDVSLAELRVWVNAAGQAWVRLLEHREHTARDPARSGLGGEVSGFVEEDGGSFAVPAAEAISTAQARRVLRYWLQYGGKAPELAWD